MILIDGKKVSADIKAELKIEIEELRLKTGKVPGLVVIIVGDNPASEVYVRNKHKSCVEVGINSIVVEMPAETTQEQLLEQVTYFNENPDFHGILVHFHFQNRLTKM